MVDKLPFAPPSDPLVSARMQRAERDGKRPFDDEAETEPLELVNSKNFSTGVLYLTYRPESEQARDDQGTR